MHLEEPTPPKRECEQQQGVDVSGHPLVEFERVRRIHNRAVDNYQHGQSLRRAGLWHEASTALRAAAEGFESIGYMREEGGARNILGKCLHELGYHRDASGEYARALTVFLKHGDQLWAGNSAQNLGCEFTDMGSVKEAIEWFGVAAEIFRRIGDHDRERRALNSIAALSD